MPNKEKILAGNNKIFIKPYEPLNDIVFSFIIEIHKEILKDKEAKKYNDLVSLAFWCRNSNLQKIKNFFLRDRIDRLGLGLLFHIAPSNVPITFAYSYLFGLLSGNTNIVKVPKQNFKQIQIFCNIVSKLFKKKKYNFIKNQTKIVRYDQESNFTKYYSNLCNARIIWGGDKTIEEVRNYKLSPRAREITFADRYSLSIIKIKKIEYLNQEDLKKLVKQFYDDAFFSDQNTCSSPHLVLWEGKDDKDIKNLFWKLLSNYVQENYQLPDIGVMDKYEKSILDSVGNKNLLSIKTYKNNIYVARLKKLDVNIHKLRGKWGYFYESNIENIDDLKNFVNIKYQTLSYFGYEYNKISRAIKKNHLLGIDRIVPIGQANNINIVWDGIDILTSLTRIISRN